MTTETKAAFARRMGVVRSTITRAAKAGRLVLDHKGRVLVEESIKRWHDTKGPRTDMQAQHAARRGAEIPQAIPNPAPEAENGPQAATGSQTDPATDNNNATEGTEASRARYKAITLHYDNSLIKLEMALRRGHRYPLASVKREALNLGGTLRAAIERLIDETAPRLALRKDPAHRRQLLQAEVRRVIRTLKSEQMRALRRIRS